MNKEALKLFIAKLREMKDQQTQFRLVRNIDGKTCYCAEGVLALTYGEITGTPVTIQKTEEYLSMYIGEERQMGALDPEFTKFFFGNIHIGLINLNDNKRLTFEQIANELEFFTK